MKHGRNFVLPTPSSHTDAWNSVKEGESLEVEGGKIKDLNNIGKKRMIWFVFVKGVVNLIMYNNGGETKLTNH